MYIRTIRSKGNEYIQLAHNYRDPKTGSSRAQVLYHFGRKDTLDLDSLRRLVKSISRFLEPGEVQEIQEELDMDWPFEFLGARQLGGSALLDGLWERLGIKTTLLDLLKQRAFETPVERLLFTMVELKVQLPPRYLSLPTPQKKFA